MSSLGVLLHNPCCIELGHSDIVYQGEIRPSHHPIFRTFVDNPHGFRAVIELLKAYQARDGIKTIGQAIARFSPPSDGNPTAVYAHNVAEACGVDVDTPILFAGYWPQILRAMSNQEDGPNCFPDSDITAGIRLAESE